MFLRLFISPGSEYATILNMQQLHTVLNILDSAWIIMSIKYVWILLNKQASEHNMASSTCCYFIASPNTENQLCIDGKA